MVAAIQNKPASEQQAKLSATNYIDASQQGLRLVDDRRLRHFSLDEFQRLAEMGFFHPDERIELINGLIKEMSPINPLHAGTVDAIQEQLLDGLGKRARVRLQAPVSLAVSSSQPQPDLAVVEWRPIGYFDRHPQTTDVFLAIEVAHSTLADDRDEMLEIYGRAGVPEYWIANIIDRQFEVYREPYVTADGRGNYKTKLTFVPGDSVAPLAFPDCKIDLAKVFPN
ncbi:MAG: hypothetical protein DCC55_01115 [Chloroflexi bacterium]|nr:MAG: hypothetical protein DCC55_01115 [Chloroflexota bacterium]